MFYYLIKLLNELNRKSYADGYVFVELGALPNNATKDVSYPLPNDASSQHWIENAWCATWYATYPIPHVDPNDLNNSISIALEKSNKIVRIKTKTNWSGYSGYIVIGYKKQQ